MKVKMILPALTEATGPYWRSIKYSLFPPLGLATLAAYLDDDDDQIVIQDEHVEMLDLDDEPDLVVIQTYITSAYRSYRLADHYRRRGAHVCLGGLHPTSLPNEAIDHADTIFLGPGEDTWPQFLADFREGHPGKIYRSAKRSLVGAPRPRRDLIDMSRYFIKNAIVVSRGCPHHCDFCYKDTFYKGGKSYYTQPVDDAITEIDTMPGKHLYFLDDNLFASPPFIAALLDGMRGMGRAWQSSATVHSVLRDNLVETAADRGLRSLFIGFESLSNHSLNSVRKIQNLLPEYEAAISKLHDLGVMINASFVFGMDGDDADVFDRTVDWAVRNGIETATFHILTPYPGTTLHSRMVSEGRMLTNNWDLYDTRHAVFKPANMSADELEEGYWRSYENFYSWRNIASAAWTKPSFAGSLRHMAYAGGWKKFEPVWSFIVRHGLLSSLRPILERVLRRPDSVETVQTGSFISPATR